MRAMATRWRMPPESSCGYLSCVLGDIETDPGDPAAGMLVALATRYALAFEAEGDVVEHGAVIEAGVVLEDHAAVGAGAGHGPAHHEHLAAGGRMLGTQAGDQPQDRALAAAAGAQNADELALVDQVLQRQTVTWRIAVNSLDRPGL